MIILAYDSSSAALSSGLYKDGKRLAELRSEPGVRHSDVLVPMIGKLLKNSRLRLSEVDILAVGLGPGSFTGLRVGVATAKILGYVLKKKIAGVSSLEAIARETLAGKSGRIAVAIDARKSQVYGAIYEQRGERFQVTQKPAIYDERKFRALSASADRTVWKDAAPSASGVAEAALAMARKKRFIDPFKLEPLYLHPRDCNATLPKK